VLQEVITHRTLTVNDIQMHVAESGEGDPVVFCHGFPGLWYSWRHQLPALAANGWRAIAPDMRGYGGTDRPASPHDYDREHTAADMVGLLDALEIERAVFVGHDFGAQLTWDLPYWAPDRVSALIQLSVPRVPRLPIKPTTAFAHAAAEHFLHLHYFQPHGPADVELGANTDEFLAKIFFALSGANRYLDCWQHPSEGNGYLDVLPDAPPLPWSWLSEEEFRYYADEFARTGFTGGLNWYRAEDYAWEQASRSHKEPVTVPTVFITGDKDPVFEMMGSDPMVRMTKLVPGLRSAHVIPGAGHFVQMEAPDEVNAIILGFLDQLR
jgi:pimeloyl-ACP methyl ester carboxylesterase